MTRTCVYMEAVWNKGAHEPLLLFGEKFPTEWAVSDHQLWIDVFIPIICVHSDWLELIFSAHSQYFFLW